ncbi:MAG: hypothetical protein A3G25_01185 [Betaproteobacteria bacterium RIFCSPLOWO2_12_FULL_63_13]|nr:MAG: hypothetical protein A3G25_01185 [Betaproteobacteria bacterium RIFCSPLOWO2_12_FULL_63_13]
MTEAPDAMRQRWTQMTQPEKNAFLHQMAHALIETGRARIWSAHVAAASQWAQGKMIAKETLGGALWRPHALWIAAIVVAGGIFFIGLHWAIAAVGAIVLLIVASKIVRTLTKSSVVSAATVSPEAFDKLWEIGLIALKLQSSPGVFAKPGTGVRWQDVVLMELGWDECMESKPLSREAAMESILSQVMGSRS